MPLYGNIYCQLPFTAIYLEYYMCCPVAPTGTYLLSHMCYSAAWIPYFSWIQMPLYGHIYYQLPLYWNIFRIPHVMSSCPYWNIFRISHVVSSCPLLESDWLRSCVFQKQLYSGAKLCHGNLRILTKSTTNIYQKQLIFT